MKTHFEHLSDLISDLEQRSVLDLGSGRGKFLIEATRRGIKAVGLELNQDYINMTLSRAKLEGIEVEVRQGSGEVLPFGSEIFDFINIAEVIEHVADPKKVMSEVFRVLKPGGLVYVSVPNRYGLKDQHFNLYFVNWLPRCFSRMFISIFGQHKDYAGYNGLQKLSDMHYFSYGKAKRFFESFNFVTQDIRETKIAKRFCGPKRLVANIVYKILKPWYFDSFHFLLEKRAEPKKFF